MINRVAKCFFPVWMAWVSIVCEGRVWTDLDGQQMGADYLQHNATVVQVRRPSDGRVFEIPIRSLSREDKLWLAREATHPVQGGTNSGVYIAAGHGGHRMSSLDGFTWENHQFWDKPAHNQHDLKAMAHGNGICVVVGGYFRSNILTTNDGVNWMKNPYNIGVLSGVVFNHGRFYIFGESGRVAESRNGKTWQLVGDAKVREYGQEEMERLELEKLNLNVRSWRFANGRYVGAGDNSILVSTKDFKDWHFSERLEPLTRLKLETDGKRFLAFGDRTLLHSANGMEWEPVAPELDARTKFASLVHDGKRFILNSRGNRGLAWESFNGKDWSLVEGQTFPGLVAALRPNLYYSFKNYWEYTDNLLYSTDQGRTWQSARLPAPAGITCILHAKDFPRFPARR